MKRILIVLLSVIFLAIILVLILDSIQKAQSFKLCNLIQNGHTEQALTYIPAMLDVNAYTASPTKASRWVHAVLDISITTPLIEACRVGDSDVVVSLLAHGADPNKYVDGGRSPIEAASISKSKNRVSIIEALIDSGANVDLCGSGNTALFNELLYFMHSDDRSEDAVFAVEQVLHLLLNKGASAEDNKNNTIIHYLSYAGDISLLTRYLEQFPYMVNQQNDKGATPIIWAINGNSFETVATLLKYGADVSLKDYSGLTAMDYAKKSQNESIIDLLSACSTGG